MNSIIIREARKDDLPQLRFIHEIVRREIFPTRPDDHFSQVTFDSEVCNDEVWVAERQLDNDVDLHVVGFMAIRRSENRITDLYILKEHRKCGIGLQLMEHAESVMEKPIFLNVSCENEGVAKFYERIGYKRICIVNLNLNYNPYICYQKD